MQLHHANTLAERTETLADHGSGEVATSPVTFDQSDFTTSDRDEILALLAPSGQSIPTTWLVLAALAGALDWAGLVRGTVLQLLSTRLPR